MQLLAGLLGSGGGTGGILGSGLGTGSQMIYPSDGGAGSPTGGTGGVRGMTGGGGGYGGYGGGGGAQGATPPPTGYPTPPPVSPTAPPQLIFPGGGLTDPGGLLRFGLDAQGNTAAIGSAPQFLTPAGMSPLARGGFAPYGGSGYGAGGASPPSGFWTSPFGSFLGGGGQNQSDLIRGVLQELQRARSSSGSFVGPMGGYGLGGPLG